VVPEAADHRLGQQPRPGESALDGHLDRLGDVERGRAQAVAVLTEKLQAANPAAHQRGRSALEGREDLLTDLLEVLQAHLQDFVGDDLDVDHREVLRDAPTAGRLRAGLGLGLFGVGLGG